MSTCFPKSTYIHASSSKFDDQRVPLFPSTVLSAPMASASAPDCSTVLPNATFVPDAGAAGASVSGSDGCTGCDVLFPPYTSISQREYPYPVPLVTPCILTYLADTVSNSTTSSPPS